MAGVAGFEPAHARVKVLCLTTWRHPIKARSFKLRRLRQSSHSLPCMAKSHACFTARDFDRDSRVRPHILRRKVFQTLQGPGGRNATRLVAHIGARYEQKIQRRFCEWPNPTHASPLGISTGTPGFGRIPCGAKFEKLCKHRVGETPRVWWPTRGSNPGPLD